MFSDTQDQWPDKDGSGIRSLYEPLNAALRGQERVDVLPYWGYIRLLQHALFKLPRDESGAIFRAFPFDEKRLPQKLEDFEHLQRSATPEIWWGFSSCSTNLKAVAKFMDSKPSVRYTVDAGSSARDVRRYSAYQGGQVPEDERLVPMGSAFVVKEAAMMPGNVLEVTVKQIDDFKLDDAGVATEEGDPPTEAQLEQKQDELGRADSGMEKGTRIYVSGHGRGSYASFEKFWVGANNHTIRFDAGVTRKSRSFVKTLQLRDMRWSVLSGVMDKLEAEATAEEEAKETQAAEAERARYSQPTTKLRDSDNPAIARAACRELGDLLIPQGRLDKGAQELAASAGAVEAIREALTKHQEPEVREAALKVLRALVDGHADNCGVLREAGGVAPVVEAMVQHLEESAIAEHSSNVLMHMAFYSRGEAMSEIIATGAVAKTVKVLLYQAEVMTSPGCDLRSTIVILCAGCDALLWLVMHGPPAVCTEVDEKGVQKALISALDALQTRCSTSMLRAFVQAMGGLSKQLNYKQT